MYTHLCLLQKRLIGILLLEVAVIATASGLVIGLIPKVKKRSTIIGIICIIFNVMMYSSPLTIAVSISITPVRVWFVTLSSTWYDECVCKIVVVGLFISWWIYVLQKKVITTKSVEYMPFYLSFTNTINGACWLIYGLLRFDINLVVIYLYKIFIFQQYKSITCSFHLRCFNTCIDPLL